MKPVHVFVLLFAGALGGALIMKTIHPAHNSDPVATATPVPPPLPTTAPPEQPEQPPAPVAEPEPPAPEPVAPEPPPAPRPVVVRREISRPRPVVIAAVPVPIPVPASPMIAPPPASPEPEPFPETPPAPPQEVVPAATAPQPHQVTLNAGLLLPVRLVDGLSSERNAPGDTFAATLDKELVAGGFVIAERGARVEGRVLAVDRAKARAAAALAVELTALHTSDGQTVTIQTEGYFKHADPSQLNSTTKIVGGAAIGAVIGAIAAGGKGAAIGAGIGGGAGAGDALLARGKPVELSSETPITFKLKSPVPLTEKLQ